MLDIFHSTTQLLAEYAKKHDSVLVSYSGGKDSLVTLDLCTRTFKRVTAFFMYFVPGPSARAGGVSSARAVSSCLRVGFTTRRNRSITSTISSG